MLLVVSTCVTNKVGFDFIPLALWILVLETNTYQQSVCVQIRIYRILIFSDADASPPNGFFEYPRPGAIPAAAPARAAMRRSNGDAFADSEKKDIFMHGIARSLFSQG